MRRMPIRYRTNPLTSLGCPRKVLWSIRRHFYRLSSCIGQVAYVLLTRAPVAGRRKQASAPAAPRLACVKPVASVHPEPGSNSSLLLSCFFFLSKDLVGVAPITPADASVPLRLSLAVGLLNQELTKELKRTIRYI